MDRVVGCTDAVWRMARLARHGAWRSLVARGIWGAEDAGSNPAALAVALATDQSGDYQSAIGFAVTDNPAPAINALADGRLHDFFALHPYMGSFSLLLRAPFVTAGRWLGADDLTVYKVGSVVCLVSLAL